MKLKMIRIDSKVIHATLHDVCYCGGMLEPMQQPIRMLDYELWQGTCLECQTTLTMKLEKLKREE